MSKDKRVLYGLAALSGFLYFLAFAGVDVWPLAFVAFVPLFFALRGQPPKRALLLGLVAGTTMNVCGFYWLVEMLKTFSGFPTVVCFFFVVVICAYQGGRVALMGWLYGRAEQRGWPPRLVFLAAFVASEHLYPLLFPWYYAATVHQVPALTQTAELGGPIAVGLVLVTVNVALAELALARIEKRAPVRRMMLSAGATLVLAVLFGVWRVHAVDANVASAESAKVGVVQANMGLMEKRTKFGEGLTRHLDATDALKKENVDFVVWSETSAMDPMREENHKRSIEMTIGRRLGVPAIFGAVLYRPDPDREFVMFNTAVSTDAAGHVNGRYDKEYLLMFGEYLPLGETFPILYKWSPHSGHFSPGKALDPLAVRLGEKTHLVSVLICYEDILPTFTNKVVAYAKPELLVNMTNDAWFGDTTEPWEHLALAQFRAIEHRRYLVRGTNSGVSAIVDPVGRVVAHSGTFHQETLTGTIHWMSGSTVYEKVGDWIWWGVSLVAVAGAFVRWKRQTADPSAAGGAPPEGGV